MTICRICALLSFTGLIALGQTFSSGSTGTDGALDLTSGDRTVALPPSGILNYTTVNIPAGRTLSFQNNQLNTPVIMLAQGAVSIAGTINLSASGQAPASGGFRGGDSYQPGWGPGGGKVAIGQQNATWIGPLSLVPIIGGSGGAGLGSCYYNSGPWGGGGGGAIAIASSTSIAVSGGITTAGAQDSSFCGDAGAGAYGAIRLVSNSLNVSGYLASAIARLEAPLNALIFTGSSAAPAVLATVNPAIVPTNPPSLTIVSIGGYPVPSYSGSSFSTVDLLLPTQLPDPLPVVIQATNVPVGSPVSIAFNGSAGATSTTAALTGTAASSTTTVYVSGVSRSAITYLFASTTFGVTLIGANVDKTKPNSPSNVQLAAAPGGKTAYRFLRSDGSEIKSVDLPEDLRRLFGF